MSRYIVERFLAGNSSQTLFAAKDTITGEYIPLCDDDRTPCAMCFSQYEVVAKDCAKRMNEQDDMLNISRKRCRQDIYIVIAGDVAEGLKFLGPFKSKKVAEDLAAVYRRAVVAPLLVPACTCGHNKIVNLSCIICDKYE